MAYALAAPELIALSLLVCLLIMLAFSLIS